MTLASPSKHRAYAPLAGIHLRVLVADDLPTNQLILQAILSRAGCTVTTVTDGRAAVEACAHETFDVVVMDIRMPEVDGLEAARAIRAAEQEAGGKRVPILICSADSEHATEAKVAGADGYLVKPITPRGLIEQIALLLPG